MEIDSPKTKEIHCDLSCLIKRLSVVPVKRKLKKKIPKKFSIEIMFFVYKNLRDNYSV